MGITSVTSGDRWFRIALPYACFGVRAHNNVIKEAPPVGRWMVGKYIDDINDWVKKKGGVMEEVCV